MQVPKDDESSTTRQELQAYVKCAMGGRVAEELQFGQDQVGMLSLNQNAKIQLLGVTLVQPMQNEIRQSQGG